MSAPDNYEDSFTCGRARDGTIGAWGWSTLIACDDLVNHLGPGKRGAPLLVAIALAAVLGVAGMLPTRGNPPPAQSAAPSATSVVGFPRMGNVTPAAKATARPDKHHAIKTVFLIVMENQNGSSIAGNAAAPYINTVLLPKASYATRYFNPPGIHPSLPNYLWLEAGTSFGITNDGDPSVNDQRTSAHLVDLLSRADISWRAYEEGISGKTCPLINAYPYAARHNPFVYFADVTGNGNPHSVTCIAHERPYAELAKDLRRNTTARYNFITPDLCHDMHDSCAPTFNQIKQGDSWLARAVPPILNSRAYTTGGVLFIVWDEAEHGDGPIPLLVLSPYAKGHGYRGNVPYTHSSLLRTLEEIFGVSPLLGDAAYASSLRDLFTSSP